MDWFLFKILPATGKIMNIFTDKRTIAETLIHCVSLYLPQNLLVSCRSHFKTPARQQSGGGFHLELQVPCSSLSLAYFLDTALSKLATLKSRAAILPLRTVSRSDMALPKF